MKALLPTCVCLILLLCFVTKCQQESASDKLDQLTEKVSTLSTNVDALKQTINANYNTLGLMIRFQDEAKARLAIGAAIFQANEELGLQKAGKGHTNVVQYITDASLLMYQTNVSKLGATTTP